jgi:hypothetical protein
LPTTEVSEALKGLQDLFGGSPASDSTQSQSDGDKSASDISTSETPFSMPPSLSDDLRNANSQGPEDRIPAAFERPLRFQMLRSPLPMFPIQSILNGLHQSPVTVHALPFGNGGFGSMPDFLPISRPLRSLRDLSQGSPLFSRSITITSDGSKTVRQETSHDADGNLVTTTTTTTRTTQKPDSFAKDQDKSNGMEDKSVRNNNAQLMFKSVLEDMPSELKDILGLPALVMSDLVKPELQNKQESRDGDVASFDQQSDVGSDAADEDEDDSDDDKDSDNSDVDSDDDDEDDDDEDDDDDTVQGDEEKDSTSDNYQGTDNANSGMVDKNDGNSASNPKPYVVAVETPVDFPSLGAVLQVPLQLLSTFLDNLFTIGVY